MDLGEYVSIEYDLANGFHDELFEAQVKKYPQLISMINPSKL